MTRERIEDYRQVLVPFVKKELLKINYENLGKTDAEEFEKDFNELLDLATKALEQQDILGKIRAEIDSLEWRCDGEDYFVNRKAVKCILDKHKAESEVSKC